MNDITKIAVYIPDEEAKQFLLFQQYFVPFTILVDHHVFEQKNATVLLDFDKYGTIGSIRRNDFLYSARNN